MADPVARLERVDPASVWKRECGDFLPWLERPENLRHLGDTVALDLQRVGREVMVGRYRADLLCRDRDSGAAVVIEAQLGPTDHAHLGQVMTYAFGLNAWAVWLAPRFSAEHCAVVQGMNRLGGAKLRCFAVEMGLWKIAGSPAAPTFTLVAGPRNWRRAEGAAPGEPVSRVGEARPRQALAPPWPFELNPIRVRRQRRGMSAKQLAEAAGISRTHLSHIELGRRAGSAAAREAIARALGVPPAALARPETNRDMPPGTGDREGPEG